jgi:hypothetical protein
MRSRAGRWARPPRGRRPPQRHARRAGQRACGLALVTMTTATTVKDVVVPVLWTRTSWPLSGSIGTHVVAKGNGRSFDQTSILTFNGTRCARLVVGESTFTIDLAAPPQDPSGGPCGGPGGDGHRGGRLPPPGHGPAGR